MFSLRAILSACLMLCTTAALAEGKEPAGRLTDEDRQLFAWFDRLGIEDFSHAKLVRVRTGKEAGTNLNQIPLDEPRAFLLWDHGRQFRVVMGDMTVVAFDRLGHDPKIEPRHRLARVVAGCGSRVAAAHLREKAVVRLRGWPLVVH